MINTVLKINFLIYAMLLSSLPFIAHAEEAFELRNPEPEALACYQTSLDALDQDALFNATIQGVAEIEKVVEPFKQCCDSFGDAKSCNKYALFFLSYKKHQDYFKKACELGYENGCKNYIDVQRH